jgi:hypothetical protein
MSWSFRGRCLEYVQNRGLDSTYDEGRQERERESGWALGKEHHCKRQFPRIGTFFHPQTGQDDEVRNRLLHRLCDTEVVKTKACKIGNTSDIPCARIGTGGKFLGGRGGGGSASTPLASGDGPRGEGTRERWLTDAA